MKTTSISAITDRLVDEFQRSLNPEAARLLDATLSEAGRLGASLYLVGGLVRDLLLHRPLGDLDLVVEGDVEALAAAVAQTVEIKAIHHRQFGTATIMSEGARLDLAMARKETYARPGALPTVTAGSIDEDLERRDFTINAMALGLSGHHEGSLLDPSGGLMDLREGVVRILHRRSFEDDVTRILRAIRYEQRLEFRLESGTLSRLSDALSNDMLATVSADRLRREIELILAEEAPVRTLLRLGELGVLNRLYAPLGRADWLKAFEDDAEPLTLVAALAFGMSPNEGQGFISRLNMPSAWAEAISGMAKLLSLVPNLEDSMQSPSSLFRMLEGCPIAAIDALSSLDAKRRRKGETGPLFGRPEVCPNFSEGWRSACLGCSPGPLGGRDSASNSGRSPGGRGNDSGGRTGVSVALFGGFAGLMVCRKNRDLKPSGGTG